MSSYNKKTIRDMDVSGKKVLLRCDFNVPHDKETGAIRDATRIVAALPTIRYLLDRNAAVILVSHMGRPHGAPQAELSLASAAKHLQSLIGVPVVMTEDVLGPDTKAKCASIQPGQIVMIENIRFRIEEEKNDMAFAKELADLADVFVFDAFGTAHRGHSSTEGVSHFLPSCAGFLVEKELEFLGKALEDPKRPLVAILGGAKVADKIPVIENLMTKADTIIIGGGMSYTFQVARGGHIGTSLLDAERVDYAKDMIARAKEQGVELLLPVDNVAAPALTSDAVGQVVPSLAIPDDLMGVDIGPETVKLFSEAIHKAGTVIWNGPMGVFEFSDFAHGTNAIARAMADLKDAITIVGGGDSASAVEKSGLSRCFTHISTGGGASLEFLEGKSLPGIVCLEDKA